MKKNSLKLKKMNDIMIERAIKKNRPGRPVKLNKKKQVNLKLPPGLIEWMNGQPESNALLIETALKAYYQIGAMESLTDKKKHDSICHQIQKLNDE